MNEEFAQAEALGQPGATALPMVLSVYRDGQWRHEPIEVTPPPNSGDEASGEGLKKWWKREVKRLRATHGITDDTLIIRTAHDVRLDAWAAEAA